MWEIRGLRRRTESLKGLRVMAGWEKKWSFSRDWSSQFNNSQSFADIEQLNFFPLYTFLILKGNHSQVLGGVSPKCFSYSIKRASSICDNPNKAETSKSLCRHDVIKPYCWEYLLPEWWKFFFTHSITPTNPPLLLATASVYMVLYRLK